MRDTGFSLLELSIVLVIIGLLAGGVMVGQDLARQAELRSVTTDVQKIVISINAFRNKYSSYPGDMPNATAYWGSATCPGDFSTPGTGTTTCNGNNDGIINGSSAANIERYRFWQHLSNAGLLEGQYTGVPSSASHTSLTVGQNVPRLKANVGLQIYFFTDLTSNFSKPGIRHSLMLFNQGSAAIASGQAAFSTEEAFALDTKTDDGLPGMGILLSPSSAYTSAPNCVDSAVASTARYNLTVKGNQCVLNYVTGW
jgi:prepilin-type N-terminal cleavage/methylation domain-containing protein